MPIQVIINQAGPLPIKATFNAPGDEPMYIEVNGSVWSQSTGVMIGIAVQLDTTPLGVAQVYSNGNATHRPVVPGYFQVQLGEGTHALYLTAANNTVSDVNDIYTAVLHY